LFHSKPQHIFLSLGRINIIGENIDCDNRFVLPDAINKFICFAVSEKTTTVCSIVAIDLNNTVKPVDKMLANYVLAILPKFKESQLPLQGLNIVAFSIKSKKPF